MSERLEQMNAEELTRLCRIATNGDWASGIKAELLRRLRELAALRLRVEEMEHVPIMSMRELMEAKHPSPQSSEELLEQATALSVYDHFREAHKSIAFIRHEFNLQGIESCAVDTVDSALYLAEFIIMARMQK